MQTFLPYPSFEQSARVLDDKRLGKQRVEVLQLLNAIFKPDAKGWKNHPATLMWKGHELSLIRYGIAICDEWTRRGFKDTCRCKIQVYADRAAGKVDPQWLGDERLHASHRANLLRKDFDFYSRYGWEEDPGMEYWWPPTPLFTNDLSWGKSS